MDEMTGDTITEHCLNYEIFFFVFLLKSLLLRSGDYYKAREDKKKK